MPSLVHHVIGLHRAVGTLTTINILARRASHLHAPMRVQLSRLAGQSYPAVELRPTESDLFVASQVFGWREYELPADLENRLGKIARAWRGDGNTPLIVDGGANTGYSSLYFAAKFPEAVVIAVEPHPVSFEILNRHAALQPSIVPLRAALWSDSNGVDLEFPDEGAWAVRTIAHSGGLRPRTPSATLEEIVAMIPHAKLLICKLDIEGAEKEVCRSSAATLQSAACVIAETHDFLFQDAAGDGGCLGALTGALAPTMTAPIDVGENIVFVNADLDSWGSAAADGARQPDRATTLQGA